MKVYFQNSNELYFCLLLVLNNLLKIKFVTDWYLLYYEKQIREV